MKRLRTEVRHFFLGHTQAEVGAYKASHPWVEWGDHLPGIFERTPEDLLKPGLLIGIIWCIVIPIALAWGLMEETRSRLRGLFKTRWVDIS